MSWWLIAFLDSIVLAFYMTMNGRYKVPGNSLVFGRSLIVTCAMLPFMFMLNWTSNPLFYVFAIGAGILSGFADIIIFNCIAQYGGAVISRITPLKIWIVFVFWMIVSPSTFLDLWADPWRFFGVVGMLGLGGYSLMHLNKCPISSKALLAVLSPILLWSFSDVMFKESMLSNDSSALISSFQFVFIMASIMTFTGAFSIYKNGGSLKQDKRMIMVSLFGAVLFFILVSAAALAINGSPNPSYVSAIVSFNVIWIYIYHKYKSIPDDSNIIAGMFFVLSSIGLILLTM